MAVKLSVDREGPAVWLIVDMGRGLGGDIGTLGGAQMADEDVVKGPGEPANTASSTQPRA
jgi:hypothetical protein